VTRSRLELLAWLLLATVALVVASLAAPGDRRLVFHVYVLVVGAVAISTLLSAIGDATPRGRRSALDRALARTAEAPTAPGDLSRMERVVTMSVAGAHDFHTRLRPLLQDIAVARLERAGRRPGPDTLGRWWELLRPDRPAPVDRFAPGISERDLRDLVADLERM
jgi:hypothetical protein